MANLEEEWLKCGAGEVASISASRQLKVKEELFGNNV